MNNMAHQSIALWLIKNTKLTSQQIADFCKISLIDVHTLSNNTHHIKIALNPIKNGMLTQEEIHRCESNPYSNITKNHDDLYEVNKYKKPIKHGPNDIISAAFWLLKKHSALSDQTITNLTGAELSLVAALRKRNNLKITDIIAHSPVKLTLCTKADLEKAISKL